MDRRVYNWIANTALLLGVASAFLYDSGKVSHSAAVALGVIAGVVAVGLYFCNQYKIAKAESSEGVVKGERKAEQPEATKALTGTQTALAEAAAAFAEAAALEFQGRDLQEIWKFQRNLLFHGYGDASLRRTSPYYPQYPMLGRHLRYSFPRDMKLMTPEVELSPKEAATCALEIVRNLAIEDKLNEWEYVFDAKGLRVSMKRRSAARAFQQKELMFEGADAFAE